MTITVTYILWSSDFALYLEDYLMYEHHTLGLKVSMARRLTSKQMTVTVTCILWSSDFALFFEDFLDMNPVLWDYESV